MIRSNRQQKERMEQAAKTMTGPFDRFELHVAIWELRTTQGMAYKERPSSARVGQLLHASPWARPFGEHEVEDNFGKMHTVQTYVFDPHYAEERKAARIAAVSA